MCFLQTLYGPKSVHTMMATTPPFSKDEYGRKMERTQELCLRPTLDGITTTQNGNTYVFKGILIFC